MEVAKFYDQDVLIAKEWFEQSEKGLPQENIISLLERKYRIHSQKKAFSCLCCNQPVSMVLRINSPHFRHQGESCPSAHNYDRYTNRIQSVEEPTKHRVGRAIIRTYLEGQLKPHSVIVQDGYLFRTLLKIVPDIILTFPDDTNWSVDYVTGSRQDESYHNYIQKRSETYRDAGFKPFFFIDSSWLAEVPDRSMVSFYKAEQQMTVSSEIDLQWSSFVTEFISTFGKPFVLREWFGLQNHFGQETFQTTDVFSLAYVDPGAGNAFIQRFIPAKQKKFGYHVYRASISLERATSLDHSKQSFTWWEPEETDSMQERLNILSLQYETEIVREANSVRLDLEQQQLRENQVEQERVKCFSTTNIPVNKNDSLEALLHEEISRLFKNDMTVSQAEQYLSTVIANKNLLTRERLECIRSQARAVMGGIQ
ncbi:hypothetical protein [Paenibacillus sp. IHBB 10380]|uniref:hypothetical protein n=1 Tax=Paenibacillus sp. IHBB 10380 TaxID=1566358 RepID=UPI0005CFDB75|nr:hypothetical protein [Paenibacillus sp. IHBB 10380]AJS58484.1 hypothetical protein UB51_08230 [Paenibacillus sp. IHBB 10380]